jgi:4,5-DOPA dioxygenase extradiol
MRQLGLKLSQLPRPEAILVISAHWGTAAPTVSNAAQPETIHDFSGFPAELYRLRYPAVGAPELAGRIVQCLTQAGLEASQQPHGLDHGAWIPLHLMFPQAEVPVLQLSVQPRLSPAHHWQVGAALRPLRDRLLIIGSGQITHNLRALTFGANAAASWTQEFTAWMQQQIEAGNQEALLNYRQQAPHAAQAHPTEEHLLPLFTVLGAAGSSPVERLDWGVSFGTLAWDGYLFAADSDASESEAAGLEAGSAAKIAASS